VEEAQDELGLMKSEMERRTEKAKRQEKKFQESPDIVVKVVCKYRAELFFKISRKTKLSRLFNAWTERMEVTSGLSGTGNGTAQTTAGKKSQEKPPTTTPSTPPVNTGPHMQFLFTHMGRSLEHDETPEDAGMEEGDEILAVEMMDLTSSEVEEVPDPLRHKIKKMWSDTPEEARKAVEDIFDGVVRERLKDVLRQYELREKHFDCVIRSKELEVLLSKARLEEQKQVQDGEKSKLQTFEAENVQLKAQLEETQSSQTRLMDKLISCCKEPTGERTQRLFSFLREELDKRGSKQATADGPVGG